MVRLHEGSGQLSETRCTEPLIAGVDLDVARLGLRVAESVFDCHLESSGRGFREVNDHRVVEAKILSVDDDGVARYRGIDDHFERPHGGFVRHTPLDHCGHSELSGHATFDVFDGDRPDGRHLVVGQGVTDLRLMLDGDLERLPFRHNQLGNGFHWNFGRHL